MRPSFGSSHTTVSESGESHSRSRSRERGGSRAVPAGAKRLGSSATRAKPSPGSAATVFSRPVRTLSSTSGPATAKRMPSRVASGALFTSDSTAAAPSRTTHSETSSARAVESRRSFTASRGGSGSAACGVAVGSSAGKTSWSSAV
ncbi:MAG: hypothetical protein IPJ65_43685 [Archangiaceae bacterium]|nr:hypothetical protein [Archangiaceae bacterium]